MIPKSDSHSHEFAIHAKALTLGYPHWRVLEHFSAAISPGEFIGILGPNGAGKTTFLRAVLGLIRPWCGELAVLGEAPSLHKTAIGYIPQVHHLTTMAQLSGRTLIEISLKGHRFGLPRLSSNERDAIDQALAQVEAKRFADRPFAQLSGGERQRILLAQALLGHPKLLLLDEPLANLDPHHQETLLELVVNIQQSLKVTVLCTAHDVNALLGIMTRVMYMANGNALIGSVEEVITNEKLSALYNAPIEVIRYQNRLFVTSELRGIVDAGTHCH